MDSISQLVETNVKKGLFEILEGFLRRPDQSLLEVTLEGISYLWMKDPMLIFDSNAIFQEVLKKLNQKSVPEAVKARIVKTFITMLSESKMTQKFNLNIGQYQQPLSNFFWSLIPMLENRAPFLRKAIGDLVICMADHGMINILKACEIYTKMLNDGFPSLRQEAFRNFHKIGSKNMNVLNSMAHPLEIVKLSYSF